MYFVDSERKTGAIMYKLKILGTVLVAGSAAAALGVMPAGASASKPIPCTAGMTNASPKQYTTTDVKVSSWGDVGVTTVAHYRTTTTTHSATTNSAGKVTIPYHVSGVTVGYRVVVNVTVRKDGRIGSCRTSFTPQRG